MKNPQVSIFIPSFNKPSLVREAIKSVLDQSFKDFELIIIENSTNSKSRTVVKSFKDPRIIYYEETFSKKERSSFYVTAFLLNKYYPTAKGKYIVFLADDDLILPNCLKIAVSFLGKNKYNIAYFGQFIEYLSQKGVTTFDSMVREPGKVLKKGEISPKNLLDGGQVIFSTGLLQKIKQPYFPIETETSEICDRLFIEKLWVLKTFYPVKKILSIKRVTSESHQFRRNPFKYNLYSTLTTRLPENFRVILGSLTNKRRRMTSAEKSELEIIERGTFLS